MYVERIRPEQLNIHESYKCGQLLLETAKMRGLNEFNLKKIWSEGEKGNVPSTSSDLSLDDKTAIRSTIKKTKRFDYSIRVDDDEGAEQNHFEEEMNDIQGEESNISPSLYRLLCARLTEKKSPGNQKNTPENQRNTPRKHKNTPGNQKNTPTKKNESNFVFLKPKVYQCHYCHKKFFLSSTYRRHMIHQLKKLYWCSICIRGFVLKTTFKRHRSFCHLV